MTLLTVKDKFQVTIPSRLRREAAIEVGDVLEATYEAGAIVLRPKAVIDRAAVAAYAERILATAPAGGTENNNEEDIVEEAIAEVRAAREERRKRQP
ncbi:MAG: AbrB/MazE/SpoVT family DNA-binding domain-containing protein [Rhodospirillales bacterium]